MTYVLLAAFGYLLGSCPWGYWLVRLVRHEDIRTRGSGNIGAANVFRTYGASLGVPVVLLDVAKGFVPALLGLMVESRLAGIVAGAAAMVGHWRPLFLGFARGGKVIATGGGVFFAVAPLVALTALALWIVLFLVTRISSVASIVTALFMPLGAWLFGLPRSVILFGAFTSAMAVWLHRANIQRLRAGTEPQSSFSIWRRLRAARS